MRDSKQSSVDTAELKRRIDLRNVISLVGETPYSNYKAGYCPFHEAGGQGHKTKSFLVYADHYLCLSPKCHQSGDVFNWTAYKVYGDPKSVRGTQFKAVLDAVSALVFVPKATGPTKLPVSPPVPVQRDELLKDALAYHDQLISSPERLAYFFRRLFSLETVRRQKFGWDGQRFTIPVWEGRPCESELLTIRFRALTKEKGRRYSGIRSVNRPLLYNGECVGLAKKFDLPLLVEYGELDAALSLQDLIPTVSNTNGAGAFRAEWLKDFPGDVVYLPDVGEEEIAYRDAGRHGSRGWVVHFPEGRGKDYGEVRASGVPASEITDYICSTIGYKSSLFKKGMKEVRKELRIAP